MLAQSASSATLARFLQSTPSWQLDARAAVLDGEAVASDADGRPNFAL
jgi:hypothetical protein